MSVRPNPEILNVIERLFGCGYADKGGRKVPGGNFIRVFREVSR